MPSQDSQGTGSCNLLTRMAGLERRFSGAKSDLNRSYRFCNGITATINSEILRSNVLTRVDYSVGSPVQKATSVGPTGLCNGITAIIHTEILRSDLLT